MAVSWKYHEFGFSSDPEIQKLQEFVLEVGDILDEVISNLTPAAVAGRHHERLKATWIEAKPKFEQVANQLGNYKKQLEEEGLTGKPLDLKLGMYHHARDEYLDHGTVKQGQSEPKSFWARFRALFHRVTKASAVILRSTAKEIPGGEYITEVVESVDLGVEMAGDTEKIS